MKIGTVLTASDLNPLYSDFIPNFIKSWSILFPEIDVVVVLVADSLPDNLSEYSKHIRLFKPIENIHTAFQAQCIRLLYPQLIERNEGVLISDMDMLPMNRFYYEDAIKNISDDTFISYRDVLLPHELPMCYNIAIPSVWKSMFEGGTIEKWYNGTNYDGGHGGIGWSTDQLMLIKKFNEFSGNKIILNDRITRYSRLDRIDGWQFSNLKELRDKISKGEYSDYHCLRPYSQHKEINDFIVDSLVQPVLADYYNIRVLLLVVSDDSLPVYKQLRDVWRLYIKLNPRFECLFLETKSDITESYIENDTLYVPGVEGIKHWSGIYEKTIKGIDYVKKDNYDYIIRTGLSCVWNFDALENLLINSPRKNFWCGKKINGVSVSGQGFIMSKDVYSALLIPDLEIQNISTWQHEDICLSESLLRKGYSAIEGQREDITSFEEIRNIHKDTYHIRCKLSGDRLNEPEFMTRIVKSIYYNFISGESIQQACDVYLGEDSKFQVNPFIKQYSDKWKSISSINSSYSNPRLVFCYPDFLPEFSQKLHLFQNPFVLVTHNSDYNVTESSLSILNSDKVVHWFAQNASITHSKLTPIPIGIANRMWDHGKLENWHDVVPKQNSEKNGIYFYFGVNTNPTKRSECKHILESKGLKFGTPISHTSYLQALANDYKYAICPEGNGIDSHRVWECLYTNTIPICIRSTNTEYFAKSYPIVLVDSWEDLDITNISSPTIEFSNTVKDKLTLYYYKLQIFSHVPRYYSPTPSPPTPSPPTPVKIRKLIWNRV